MSSMLINFLLVLEVTKYSTCDIIVQRRSTSTKADASGEALAPPHGGNTHLNIRNYPLGQRNVVSAVGGCIIRVCKLLCSV